MGIKVDLMNYRICLPNNQITTPELLLNSLKTFYSDEESELAYNLVKNALYVKNDNVWVMREDGTHISLVDLYIRMRKHYRSSVQEKLNNTMMSLELELHGLYHLRASAEAPRERDGDTKIPTAKLPNLDFIEKHFYD